jgi:hypothetical protein
MGETVCQHQDYFSGDRGFDEFEVFTDQPDVVSVCAAHIQVDLERHDVIRLRDQLNAWLVPPRQDTEGGCLSAQDAKTKWHARPWHP